jgi:phage terminase large subunit GpA-like protein
VTVVTPIARAWLQGYTPPPKLTVSEWAAMHRRLPETSAAKGSKWDNRTAPYLTGIMNAVLERGIKILSLCKAAQCGASEAMTTTIGYLIEHRPTPILMVMPTATAAQAYGKERLSDLIRSTPALRARVTDGRVPSASGLPESTQTMRMYPGGFLALAGGNSPNSVARWSVRVAIADDCDRLPRYVGLEGDPGQLLINRTTSYHDGLTMFVSTPVSAGGRVESLYAQSDRRRYFLPCPACGRWDYTTWKDENHWRVVFEERRSQTARLVCTCGHEVREPQRMDLVRAGEWRPTADPLARGNVGFHLPAMISPFVTLSGLADKFISAMSTMSAAGPRRLKEFVTTQLAEGWKDEAASADPAALESRLEDF